MTEPLLSRRLTFVAASPVFCALWVYAYAHDRWLPAIPFALALAIAISTRTTVDRRSWHLLVAILVGAALGGAMLWVSRTELPASAFSPGMLSPMCGALACLSCFTIITQRYMWAWVYAWMLAGFCLNVPPSGPIWFAFGALVLATLACCFVLGGMIRLGGPASLAFVGFVALTLLVAQGLGRLALASEQWLIAAAERWARDLDPPSGLGLKDDVTLSDRSHVDLSSRAILEIDGTPPGYLRTMVMRKFDGVQWMTEERPQGGRILRDSVMRTPPIDPPPEELRRKLSMLFYESLDDVIPAPAGTYDIHGTKTRHEAGWVWRTMEGTIRNEIELDRGVYEQLPNEPKPAPMELQLPKDPVHGDLRQLLRPYALSIVGDAKTTREKAERIERFFRSQFLYSLDSDLRGRGHPLEVLIRERRPTYCVYFASAMAVLLRTLDIPARLVTGFVPLEMNPVNGRTVVRLRDAHAWVEAYVPEEGRYDAFDPTPSRSREQALGLGQKESWFKAVMLAVGSALRRAWMAVRQDPFGVLVALLRSPFVAIPVCGLALWQLFGRRRRSNSTQRHRKALESEDRRLRAAYRRYLKLLGKAGLMPGRSETDDELLARLARTRGERAATAANAFVSAYRRARYADEAQHAALPALLQELDSVLRKAG